MVSARVFGHALPRASKLRSCASILAFSNTWRGSQADACCRKRNGQKWVRQWRRPGTWASVRSLPVDLSCATLIHGVLRARMAHARAHAPSCDVLRCRAMPRAHRAPCAPSPSCPWCEQVAWRVRSWVRGDGEALDARCVGPRHRAPTADARRMRASSHRGEVMSTFFPHMIDYE